VKAILPPRFESGNRSKYLWSKEKVQLG